MVMWILHAKDNAALNTSELGGWIFIIPLSLLCVGIFNLTGYVANRRSQYKIIAQSLVVQSAIAVSINIVLGLTGAKFAGLIIGNISGLVLSLSYLLFMQRDFVRKVPMPWSARKMALARRYKDFPVYNASTGVLDGLKANLPIFFMIAFFTPEIVGLYALVIRVLNAPVQFISTAVSRVNLKKVVDLVNNGKRVERYLMYATAGLLSISLPPTIIFFFWGPKIFSFVFGQEWLQAGQISQVLAISLAIKFVSSTLSSTLGATNNNRYGALWRIVAFTSTAVVLGLAARTGSVDHFILALVLNEVAIYLFYFYLIFLAARNPRNNDRVRNSRNI